MKNGCLYGREWLGRIVWFLDLAEVNNVKDRLRQCPP